MKSVAKFLGVLVAVAALTAVIFAIAMSTSWGEDVVQKMLQDQLNQDQLTRVTIGEVTAVSLLSPPGALTVSASAIDVKTADDQLLVGISELRGKVWIAPMLWRKLSVSHLELSGVELLSNDRGQPLVAGALSGGGFKERAVDIEVDHLVITSLFLVTIDRGKRVLGRLSGELDLFAPADDARVLLNLKSARGTLSKPSELKIVDARGIVDTGDRVVATITFEAETEQAELVGRLRYIPSDSKPVQTHIQSVRTRDGRSLLDMVMPSLDNFLQLPPGSR